jgi:hypothetical protein
MELNASLGRRERLTKTSQLFKSVQLGNGDFRGVINEFKGLLMAENDP